MPTDRKTALVTGGTRGIGLAIAQTLAEQQYALVVAGQRDEQQAAPALNELKKTGPPVLYVQANIAREEDRQSLVEQTMAAFGRIDVLVNNAGTAPRERVDLLQMTEESMDHVLGVNLKGAFFLTQRVAQIMIDATKQDASRRPLIINISSISAYTSSTSRGEYCIAKAGLSMVTQLFADRLAQYGINVYEIRPGVVATDMTAGVREKYDALIAEGLTPIQRWGTPQDVADAVSVICSGKLGFSTGEVLNVDGGFHLRRL